MLIREFSLKIFGDCVDCFQLLNGGRQLIKNGFFCLFFGDQKDWTKTIKESRFFNLKKFLVIRIDYCTFNYSFLGHKSFCTQIMLAQINLQFSIKYCNKKNAKFLIVDIKF